jgi:hypothetical protein
MTRRTAITKELRFSVFQRDNFTCRYCGRVPPNVILQIDHIVPVSKGGKNEKTNLITSCADCNYGKKDKPVISQATISIQELQKEEIEQLKAYVAHVQHKEKVVREIMEILQNKWKEMIEWGTPKPTGFETETSISICALLKKFPFEDFSNAIEITAAQNRRGAFRDKWQTEKYFWGVFWGIQKRKIGEHK